MKKNILTKEFLIACYNNNMSSNDISLITNINSRTIRWYMKKLEVPTLKSKKHVIWNKGLDKTNDIVKKICERAREARKEKGNPIWNKGLKIGGLSKETKLKISIALKGKYTKELNSNWKGGLTPINKLIRKSPQLKEWRILVFERDNYICKHCNIKGGELNAHHIKAFLTHPELRFDIDNGITLCKKCHIEEHKKIKRTALSTW